MSESDMSESDMSESNMSEGFWQSPLVRVALIALFLGVVGAAFLLYQSPAMAYLLSEFRIC